MALIDEQIQDAMRKGQFANLPGEGKPLKLDDDSHTPEHLRMAHKVLRDNGLVPDWMAQGQELDAVREKLTADIRRAAKHYQGALNDAARSEQNRQVVEQNWRARVAELNHAAQKYNGQVLSYNLKVPKGVAHKRHVDFERELNQSR